MKNAIYAILVLAFGTIFLSGFSQTSDFQPRHEIFIQASTPMLKNANRYPLSSIESVRTRNYMAPGLGYSYRGSKHFGFEFSGNFIPFGFNSIYHYPSTDTLSGKPQNIVATGNYLQVQAAVCLVLFSETKGELVLGVGPGYWQQLSEKFTMNFRNGEQYSEQDGRLLFVQGVNFREYFNFKYRFTDHYFAGASAIVHHQFGTADAVGAFKLIPTSFMGSFSLGYRF